MHSGSAQYKDPFASPIVTAFRPDGTLQYSPLPSYDSAFNRQGTGTIERKPDS